MLLNVYNYVSNCIFELVRSNFLKSPHVHRTALHLACTTGQSSVVSLLIHWDCNLNARDKEGKTALIKVCSSQPCPREMDSM